MLFPPQIKEDALKQLRRLQAHIKELQREAEEALQAKEDMAATLKDNQKKVSAQGVKVTRIG